MYLFPVGPLFDFDGEFRIEAECVLVGLFGGCFKFLVGLFGSCLEFLVGLFSGNFVFLVDHFVFHPQHPWKKHLVPHFSIFFHQLYEKVNK